MSGFKISNPKKTSFSSGNVKSDGVSYKGIPNQYNEQPIERKTRLSIAKQMKKIKERDNIFDLYYDDEFIKTFSSRDEALKHVEKHASPDMYHLYDVKSRPKKIKSTDADNDKKDNTVNANNSNDTNNLKRMMNMNNV